jgi:hypothetical protein
MISSDAYAFASASFDELKTALNSLAAERVATAERKKQEETARLEKIAARLTAWVEDRDEKYYGKRMKYLDDPDAIKLSHSDLYAKVIALRDVREREWEQVECDRIAQEERIRRDKKVEKAKKEQEEADHASDRAAYRTTWVNEHGTPSQKERQEAGLLPDDEVNGAIECETFAPLYTHEFIVQSISA